MALRIGEYGQKARPRHPPLGCCESRTRLLERGDPLVQVALLAQRPTEHRFAEMAEYSQLMLLGNPDQSARPLH